MAIETKSIENDAVQELLGIEESHFVDLKGKALTPGKLSKVVSALANASGGEVFVGIDEFEGAEGKERKWDGFLDVEEANDFFAVLQQIDPLGSNHVAEFLRNDGQSGLVLHLTIFKSQAIITATDDKVYIRRSASSLPVKEGEALDRLKFDKGINSFEDEKTSADLIDVTNSEIIIEFLLDVVPTGEPDEWVKKQRLVVDGRPTVAGVLLYSDNPQSIMPKRSAVKIMRYQTKQEAERDFLVFDPITIEGPIYDLIYDSVDEVKEIIESIEKAGSQGMEKVIYPEEALHEIITNAVLHRDYSVAADVQIRIFDNRVEIESPGRLPGHVTVQNITKTQFARNPKLVRLVNKFSNPPNKDVGEGINTAFEAMEKLRLKKPIFIEGDGSVTVTLKHESLASPEQIVLAHLEIEPEITNQIARELTGIKSENSMKQVFYKLRDMGQLEQTPKVKGKKPSWRKPTAV